MKAWTRWQDWVVLALGILLFIAPFVSRAMASSYPASAWDGWILGIIGVILALLSLGFAGSVVNTITEILTLILGVVLFISPWVLGFTALSAMAGTAWVIGVLFFVAGGWTLFDMRERRIGAPAS